MNNHRLCDNYNADVTGKEALEQGFAVLRLIAGPRNSYRDPIGYDVSQRESF